VVKEYKKAVRREGQGVVCFARGGAIRFNWHLKNRKGKGKEKKKKERKTGLSP
jgi:hypothetical protein